MLDDVTRRISRSAIYSPDQRFRIFICNDQWRLALYSERFSGGMGGVADTGFTRNVYIRRADIPRNRLIPPRGWKATMSDRPLSYYLAHELTHVMESRAFGRGSSVRYPNWLNEGYADYIGKGGALRPGEERRRPCGPASCEMDPKASGLYRRHHLEVAYLLDRQGQTIRQLYADPPDEAALRARIMADRSLYGLGRLKHLFENRGMAQSWRPTPPRARRPDHIRKTAAGVTR